MKKYLLTILLILTACTSSHKTEHPWADALRALDLANATNPANDITAVYLRQQNDILQIRVDLLDFQNPNDLSLAIRIEDEYSLQEPAFNIHIPSQTTSPRITLDPLLATVIVDIHYADIPPRPRVDVSTPEDKIRGLTLDGPIPTQTAPLLLTFYDTFAGRFPAEALRSWDGAHTGPRGERHGLKHLLDAADAYHIPIVLLDLKDANSLSALDAMDALPQVSQGTSTGLLILPDVERTYDFYLPSSTFLYAPSLNPLEYKYYFAFLHDTAHIYHAGKATYVPVTHHTNKNQPTSSGPTLEVRRALLATALNNDENEILVLGGSLRDTTWGSPNMVGVTMAYFASRPYIRILNEKELLNFPTKNGKPDILPQPETSLDELSLQARSAMEYATSWAENPPAAPIAHCQSDQTGASFPDCVLANETHLAILAPEGARLTYLFLHNETGLHQFIGPSWQVAPGIDIYPGAFADVDDSFQPYESIIEAGTLVFSSLAGKRVKKFRLTDNGLEVEYQMQEPVTTQIPLLIDPWTRFTPGWAENYMQENTPGGIAWGLKNGPMINIQFDGQMSIHAFNESLSLLSTPEDPDFDYPPGHYVPFPMAIVELEMQIGYFLRLERWP